MKPIEAYFDDRLREHGIDYIAWNNAGEVDHDVRMVSLRFPVPNAQPVEITERVVPNAQETEYRAVTISEDLRERGILDIRVEVFREAPVHSDIYITIEGEVQPLRVTKPY